jgi:hypothetical protein
VSIDSAVPYFRLFGPAAVALLVGVRRIARARRERRVEFIEEFDFGKLLDARLAKRRPQFGPDQRTEVFEGLRDWFHVCNAAGRRQVSMPSQAIDDAWHEFILFTRNYDQFCKKSLGRFLHHVPAQAMQSPTQAQAGLRRTWKLACRRAGIDPRNPTVLPPLFAMDDALGLDDGFRYQLNCLAGGGTGRGGYCASHIGCSSCGSGGSCSGAHGGCSGSCSGSCGGGCGGGD